MKNRKKIVPWGILLSMLLVGVLLSRGSRVFSSKEKVSDTIQMEEQRIPEASIVIEEGKAENVLSDLSESFSAILAQGKAGMYLNYPIDESFLLWVNARYGDEVVRELAQAAMDGIEDSEVWYEKTGSSIHVLWLEYCNSLNYSSYLLPNVTWKEAASTDQIVIDFTGDINFDESWYTMEAAAERDNGILDCFSEDILQELKSADITMVNNEFTYTTRGEPIQGKSYTFRADPAQVSNLELFGTDIVSLANNHSYDFGEVSLLDTMETLRNAGVVYVGAGENIQEAMLPQFFIINGRKIAFVAATQIEKSTLYTKQATEDAAGVLRTSNPKRFVAEIEQAKKVSDYVIVYVHWGSEGMLYPEEDQKNLAKQYAEAGADLIVGNHSHRLQGAYYVEGVPVFYSLGNFWFSDGALYTTILQVRIAKDGAMEVSMLPCMQQDMTTSMLKEETEIKDFYEYVADISENVVFDERGMVSLQSTAEEGESAYQSGSHYGTHSGAYDLLGRRIDIVGNLRN